MSIMKTFTVIIIVQLFFGAMITLYINFLPDDMVKFVGPFANTNTGVDLAETANSIEDTLTKQTNLPIIDVGALAFYSGNIILDFIVNSAFAIPEMVGILLNGILMLVSLDTTIAITIQLFATVAIMVWYFIGLLQFISELRTGNQIA